MVFIERCILCNTLRTTFHQIPEASEVKGYWKYYSVILLQPEVAYINGALWPARMT